MSFRTRLTSFFVLIVVTPMLAVGFLVFRLISDSQEGKADARANGVATAAASLYQSESLAARGDAQAIARAVGATPTAQLRGKVSTLASQAGLARVTIDDTAPAPAIDVGDPTAIAPGTGARHAPAREALTITASELTASEYAHQLNGPNVGVVVRQNGRTLASTVPATARSSAPAPRDGHRRRHGLQDGDPELPRLRLERRSRSRCSRASRRQPPRSRAAGSSRRRSSRRSCCSRSRSRCSRRAGCSDSSRDSCRPRDGSAAATSPSRSRSRVTTSSRRSARSSTACPRSSRSGSTSSRRSGPRLREAIRRIGQTFASNLDRQALLELALKTAIDAAQASAGRVSARPTDADPLAEAAREGAFDGFESAIYQAEHAALDDGVMGEVRARRRWRGPVGRARGRSSPGTGSTA